MTSVFAPDSKQLPICFGVALPPAVASLDEHLLLAQAAEAAGLDLNGVMDHPYHSRYLDTLSLIGMLLARSERVHIFPDVANLPLRPPAMLAKAAASLDLLSGGRVELGLGAGGFWEAIKAMGGPVRAPGESVSALEEAIEVIRLVWSGGRGVRFDGKFYQLAGLNAGPLPAHQIGIWLGAYKPRMLRLVGKAADGWVPSFGYLKQETMPEANARIDDAARAAGRDPAAIRRVLNVAANLTADEIAELALEHGFDTFVIGETQEDVEAELREFLENVAPKTRELVAAGRASH